MGLTDGVFGKGAILSKNILALGSVVHSTEFGLIDVWKELEVGLSLRTKAC